MPACENPKTDPPDNEKHADRAFPPFVEPLATAMPIYTAASDLPTLRIEVVSVERGAIKMVS